MTIAAKRGNALRFKRKRDAMLDQSPKRPMITRLPIHTIGVINVVGEREKEERSSPHKGHGAPGVTPKNKDTALSRVSYNSERPYTPRRFALLICCVGYATTILI
ncbi:hypothetical protein M0804_013306 [Polistes exclamans]|nr:hypothetical protein M0804_013306 [Polistes exclamans]